MLAPMKGQYLMRSSKHFLIGLVALTAVLASASAWPHGGRGYYRHGYWYGPRVDLGFVAGAPLWYPGPVFSYPYPYPYPYAYPPAIVVPPAPRVYIERDARVTQESAPGYWYYCRESNTYYPYVKECGQPWERVPAQPRNP